MLLEQYKYTYEQMSDMLRRSPGAIQRRCADLGLKARPVRINPHGPEAVWHQEDYDRLAEGIKSGESYMSISKALGKSEKAIRGKVYYCYLTENADKVRAMMAGGNWGDGAPEPTVWQARLLSRSRAEADYNDDAGRGSELPHPAGRLRSGTGRPLEPILAAHDMPALG